MATTEEPRAKDPTVRIQEPVKEPKPRPPPLDLSSGDYVRKTSTAGTSSGPKTPTSGTPRHDKEKKIGHRRVDDTGQVTYKKKTTTELMDTIQLGIGQSVGRLSNKPERDVLLCDFSVVESVFYPREGSNLTPAHHYSDFRFKTYAPIAFRYFRELFGIQPDDFLLSMCNEALQELSNPGASGSIFYITNDDEFIIKTVQHKEAEFLQKLLPGYYMNLNQNPRTLLPKFYGLYCYQCGGKNIRFVVMNNLLPTAIKLHEKYDLKGSTYKRKASKRERAKKCPTLKDLDFLDLHPDGIMLEAETYTALVKTIERDCRVLQSFKIMDYSLLLGIHNLDLAIKEKEQASEGVGMSVENFQDGPSTDGNLDNSALSRGRSVRQRIAAYSTAMEAIQAQAEPVELENEDVPPGGIPARNTRGERLLLYVGIIDILQSYRLQKKLEHAFKAAIHDGDTISVHRPGFYGTRFQDFMSGKVFKKIPSLDQPQIKGPHMRFRKLVHLVSALVNNPALKHSPSKKKSNAQRQRSITTTEIEEKERADRPRSQTTGGETGAIGGRPDLLPNTSTPPPHAASARDESGHYTQTQMSSHTTSASHVVSVARMSAGRTSGDGRLDPGLSEGEGHGHSGLLGSPAHSISESTPTHTEYTEGTPSFTTSSPSCSSDMLDTPQSVRGSGSRQVHEVSTEQIHIEVINGSVSMDNSSSGNTVIASADGSLGRDSGASRSPNEHVAAEGSSVDGPGISSSVDGPGVCSQEDEVESDGFIQTRL